MLEEVEHDQDLVDLGVHRQVSERLGYEEGARQIPRISPDGPLRLQLGIPPLRWNLTVWSRNIYERVGLSCFPDPLPVADDSWLDSTSCTAAVISCLTFYFISKVLISLFLLERVNAFPESNASRRLTGSRLT